MLALASSPLRAEDVANPSGLPLPRFVSLKSDRVNVRKGPGTNYPIAWVFSRAGLPVEVIREFENWRQIRDSEGAEGWVLQNLLSGRRTALVMPWEMQEAIKAKAESLPTAEVHDAPATDARVTALVEAGALASVVSCDKTWCLVSISEQRGYVEQTRLWGVYPAEELR
ncbi:MAG: SH3 domain-containing protein [Hyphomicrobiaceae bacterium]